MGNDITRSDCDDVECGRGKVFRLPKMFREKRLKTQPVVCYSKSFAYLCSRFCDKKRVFSIGKVMERGYLHSVVRIVLVTLLGLLALHFLPVGLFGGAEVREVDMLSDLRDSTFVSDEEMLDLDRAVAHHRIDSCRVGLECINDMSGTADRGMEPLYRALDSLSTLGRPVRIAVLGDSYIEGDIFTAHLRERMQTRWGGSGVGFVPMTDAIAGFRTTVRHRFGGWGSHHANDPQSGYSNALANLTGHYFTGGAGAWVMLGGVGGDVAAHLDTCAQSSFYFMGHGSGEVAVSVNDGPERRLALTGTGGVASVSVDGAIGSVKWRVTRSSGLTFLGASLDPTKGIIVDNFALRSSSGVQLSHIAPRMFADFDTARHYDLIVIMYGLNVAGRQTSKYEGYRETMTRAILAMSDAMPETGFLLVGSTDREERAGGGFRTYRGVLSLINVQQQIAYDCHIAFWNLYKAMGGQGSVVTMVNNGEANKDYTHINFKGGRRLSGLLFDAIEWGVQTVE